jgi:ankyrin repeat protein
MEDVIRQLIRDGDAEGAERLLREHPELRDARMSFGRTWLHFAAGRGVLELVRPLFALGIPLNTTDESGECPLSAVARHGDVGLVRWMLAEGADPAISQWPMIDAVSTGEPEIVRMLVPSKTDYSP